MGHLTAPSRSRLSNASVVCRIERLFPSRARQQAETHYEATRFFAGRLRGSFTG